MRRAMTSAARPGRAARRQRSSRPGRHDEHRPALPETRPHLTRAPPVDLGITSRPPRAAPRRRLWRCRGGRHTCRVREDIVGDNTCRASSPREVVVLAVARSARGRRLLSGATLKPHRPAHPASAATHEAGLAGARAQAIRAGRDAVHRAGDSRGTPPALIRSFDVLDLRQHLLDQHFQLHRGLRHVDVGDFDDERVGSRGGVPCMRKSTPADLCRGCVVVRVRESRRGGHQSSRSSRRHPCAATMTILPFEPARIGTGRQVGEGAQ